MVKVGKAVGYLVVIWMMMTAFSFFIVFAACKYNLSLTWHALAAMVRKWRGESPGMALPPGIGPGDVSRELGVTVAFAVMIGFVLVFPRWLFVVCHRVFTGEFIPSIGIIAYQSPAG